MTGGADERRKRSTFLLVARLVAGIVVPVGLIGAGLWWMVAGESVDQAVEQRAVTVARAMSVAVDPYLEMSGDTVSVDSVAVGAATSGVLEPVLGGPVEVRIVGLDGRLLHAPSAAEVGTVPGLATIVDESVLQGVASGRALGAVDDLHPVSYSVPLGIDGATVAAARVDVLDDRAIADATTDARRLSYLFAAAFLAIVIALVPLCWVTLGEVRRQFRRTRVLAMNDQLTGLANRTQFHDRLDEAIAGADRSQARVGLVMLDLDGFKAINDTGGHAAGDRLLRRVAAGLGEATRRHEVACRLGGDEFAVVAPSIADREELRRLAERLHARLDLDVPFTDGRSLRVTASLGLALYPDDAPNADELVQQADRAMYQVKAARKAKLREAIGGRMRTRA